MKREDDIMLQIKVEARGNRTEDLEDALQEVLVRIGQGYQSGWDQNDEGEYRFQLSEGEQSLDLDRKEKECGESIS